MKVDITQQGSLSAATRNIDPESIIHFDARQHGCDRQGVLVDKAARTEARALIIFHRHNCRITSARR